MKVLYVAILAVLFSCNSGKKESSPESDKVQELEKKVNELTEQQQQVQQQKEREATKAKEKEVQGNKELIVEQIKMGEGIVTNVKHDPVGAGGITNGTLTVENALSGIVFQMITVETTVYLANGSPYQTETYTFTNLKPGDARSRNIPNTGTRGTKCEARVTEIQSKWLTNGKVLTL